MKFLIIGSSGFIGSQALSYLQRLDYDAIGTNSASFDLRTDRIENCLPEGYFRDGEPVCAVIFACICQLDRCRREQETSRLVNVTGTMRLLDDLVRLNAKPVFISSSYVHDGRDGYYSEEAIPNPINEYGRQKLEVEEYVSANFSDVLILRLDKIVGDDPRTAHLFSEWDRLLDAGQPITCIADQILSPTLAVDVARAVVAGCEEGLSGIYNVANSEFFSREELARQFARASGRDAAIISKPLEEFPFDDPRPLKSYLDSAKFRSATGMQFTSMSDAFDSYLEKKRELLNSTLGIDGVRE